TTLSAAVHLVGRALPETTARGRVRHHLVRVAPSPTARTAHATALHLVAGVDGGDVARIEARDVQETADDHRAGGVDAQGVAALHAHLATALDGHVAEIDHAVDDALDRHSVRAHDGAVVGVDDERVPVQDEPVEITTGATGAVEGESRRQGSTPPRGRRLLRRRLRVLEGE